MIREIIQVMILILLLAILSCQNILQPHNPDKKDDPINNNDVYQIVFVSDREVTDQYQVYTMDSHGKNQVRLTHDSRTGSKDNINITVFENNHIIDSLKEKI